MSTAALADSLTVTFTPTGFGSAGQLIDDQQSVWSDTTTSIIYTGTFSATASSITTPSQGILCLTNPTTTLSYAQTAKQMKSGITLNLGTPLCIGGTGFSGTFTIVPGSGFGEFDQASGGGTAIDSPLTQAVTFTETTPGGAFDPPSIAATPELDSRLLMGSGGLGLIGFGILRMRARRGQRSS